MSRRHRWTQLDEDVTYTSKQLDRDVVNVVLVPLSDLVQLGGVRGIQDLHHNQVVGQAIQISPAYNNVASYDGCKIGKGVIIGIWTPLQRQRLFGSFVV